MPRADSSPRSAFSWRELRLRVEDESRIEPEFLSFALVDDSSRAWLRAHAVGAVMPNLNEEVIRGLPLLLPPTETQRAIARILGSFEEMIKSYRLQAQTLDEMARTIFKNWFIDFAPVRANAAGRSPPHLAWAVLFPDHFEDSTIGPIPAGWKVRTIADLADVVGGSTPSTKKHDFWNGGTHHWATPKDLSGLTVPVLLDTQRKITDAGLGCISSGLLPIGTVLLSSRAPIGYLAISQVPVAVNQGFIAMKPKAGVPSEFLLRWAQSSQAAIASRANGSTFLEISKANFRPIQVVVPPENVFRAFSEVCGAMFQQVVNAERQSRTLAGLRDALLPKLISGELRVPEAEQATFR